MIDLSSEPSLGSLILTRDGVLKYRYLAPHGMVFPNGTEGSLRFTDRSGGEYEFSPHEGVLADDSRSVLWEIDPNVLNHVPAGANFEVFVTYDGMAHKVRYGRVVRKEAEYPLSPLAASDPPPLLYEDDMQRSMPGPRWIAKSGRVSMHDRGGSEDPRWAMASRNAIDVFGAGLNLFQSAAALWYAPLQTDTIEMAVGLLDGGEGDCNIVFCSNYAMTSYIGVRFRDTLSDGDRVQVITGSAWNTTVEVGAEAGIPSTIPDDGAVYRITFNNSTNQVKVFLPGADTPLLTTVISTSVPHGPGYRYSGAAWFGTLINTGPKLFSWKIKDVV